MTKRAFSSTLALLSMGLVGIAGCQSDRAPTHVPVEYFDGTSLDRNPITAQATTEYLEVKMNPADSQLRLTELARIRGFFADYNSRGHGPLIMSVPQGAENPQLAIEAVVEARGMAWEAGIEYEQIAGSAYDARGRAEAPLVMAFRAYKAIAPDCKSLAEVDFSNATSNSDQPTLGCAVRTNMAAMIADPADIYGLRVLEEGDGPRNAIQFEKWRQGQPSGSERSGDESGAVSSAVN